MGGEIESGPSVVCVSDRSRGLIASAFTTHSLCEICVEFGK